MLTPEQNIEKLIWANILDSIATLTLQKKTTLVEIAYAIDREPFDLFNFVMDHSKNRDPHLLFDIASHFGYEIDEFMQLTPERLWKTMPAPRASIYSKTLSDNFRKRVAININKLDGIHSITKELGPLPNEFGASRSTFALQAFASSAGYKLHDIATLDFDKLPKPDPSIISRFKSIFSKFALVSIAGIVAAGPAMAVDSALDYVEEMLDQFGDSFLDPTLDNEHPYNALKRLGISALQMGLTFRPFLSGEAYIEGAWNAVSNRQKENLLREKEKILEGKDNFIDAIIDQTIADIYFPLDIINGVIAGYFDAAEPFVKHTYDGIDALTDLIKGTSQLILENYNSIYFSNTDEATRTKERSIEIASKLAQGVFELSDMQTNKFRTEMKQILDQKQRNSSDHDFNPSMVPSHNLYPYSFVEDFQLSTVEKIGGWVKEIVELPESIQNILNNLNAHHDNIDSESIQDDSVLITSFSLDEMPFSAEVNQALALASIITQPTTQPLPDLVQDALSKANKPKQEDDLSEVIGKALAHATNSMQSYSLNVKKTQISERKTDSAEKYSKEVNQALSQASIILPETLPLSNSVQDALNIAQGKQMTNDSLPPSIHDALVITIKSGMKQGNIATCSNQNKPEKYSKEVNQALGVASIILPKTSPLSKSVQDALNIAKGNKVSNELLPLVIQDALANAIKSKDSRKAYLPLKQQSMPISANIRAALTIAKQPSQPKQNSNAPKNNAPTIGASTSQSSGKNGAAQSNSNSNQSTISTTNGSSNQKTTAKSDAKVPSKSESTVPVKNVSGNSNTAKPQIKNVPAENKPVAKKIEAPKTTPKEPKKVKQVKKVSVDQSHPADLIEIAVIVPEDEIIIDTPIPCVGQYAPGQKKVSGHCLGIYTRIRGTNQYVLNHEKSYEIIRNANAKIQKRNGNEWVTLVTSKAKELLSSWGLKETLITLGALGDSISLPLALLGQMMSLKRNTPAAITTNASAIEMSGKTLVSKIVHSSTALLLERLAQLNQTPKAFFAPEKQLEVLRKGLLKQFKHVNRPNKFAKDAKRAIRQADKAASNEKARQEEAKWNSNHNDNSSNSSYSSSGYNGGRDRGGCSDRATANETSSGHSNSYSYTKCDYNGDGSRQCESGTGTFGSGLGGDGVGSRSVSSRW